MFTLNYINTVVLRLSRPWIVLATDSEASFFSEHPLIPVDHLTGNLRANV